MRTHKMLMVSSVTVGILSLLPTAASALELKDFIGKWKGEWRRALYGGGDLNFTIVQVEGDKAFGDYNVQTTDGWREGKLNGSVIEKDGAYTLTFTRHGGVSYWLQLVSPGRMEGRSEGSYGSAPVWAEKQPR